MVELQPFFAGLFGEQLEILILVDLDEGDSIAVAILRLQSEGFSVAEKVLIEYAGLGEVADVERHVGVAQNARPAGLCGAQDGKRQKQRGSIHVITPLVERIWILHESGSHCK